MNPSSVMRTAALALVGAFALIVAVWTGWTHATRGDKNESNADASSGGNSAPRSTATSPIPARAQVLPLPPVPRAETSEDQRLAEEKARKLTELIGGLKEYERMLEALYRANPKLREVQGWIRSLRRMPETEVPKGWAEYQNLAKQSPEFAKALFTIMHSTRPVVILGLIGDSKVGAMMPDIFEVAGMKNTAAHELEMFDLVTGYKGTDPHLAASSFEAFKQCVEERAGICEAAGKAKAIQHGVVLTDSLRGFMLAEMHKEILTDYLKLYYDSFFGGEIAAFAATLKAQEREYYGFPKSVTVPPELWKEFVRIRKPLRLETYTKAKDK